MDCKELLSAARAVAPAAYAPYSGFRVGAALLFEDGSVYTGVNVENRSYGLTICAERSAVTKAVGEGHRKIVAVAVSCPDARYPVSPCGACRQVLSEFSDPDCPVCFEDGEGKAVTTTLGELFPYDALHDLKET
ncbi:MAG: cytidine deaminase [Spirochaetales bacterium]|nr:cytidine deaminase [Spirochaetales bacterium]